MDAIEQRIPMHGWTDLERLRACEAVGLLAASVEPAATLGCPGLRAWRTDRGMCRGLG